MSTWKPWRISEIINEIAGEKYVLPVIQRRLVWDEEKMELLFDTLLKGDSFGGIMVIEEEEGSKPLFNYRPFSLTGEIIPSKNVDKLQQSQYFVIDGQQRLQTFYMGLSGSINGKDLYFDLFSDYNNEFEFKFESDSDKLPKQSKDNGERKIPEHYWYPAKQLLRRLKKTDDEDQVATEIIQRENVLDDVKKTHISKNVKAFYKHILNSETVGISTVVLNRSFDETTNRQRIVELFRRLNDGGTKLSSFDLVASILKGFAWEMEGFLEDTLKDNEEIGLSQDNLIKLLFLLQDDHQKEMAFIEATDADFAIKNRERIKCTLESLREFLNHSKLFEYYKGGNRSFIPLFFVAYHLFHKKISDNEVVHYFNNFDAGNPEFYRIKKWVVYSLLNGVFRSRGVGWIPYKTGIRKLLDEIKKYKNADFPVEQLFQVYLDHPITFTTNFEMSNLDQLDNSFLFYMLYDMSRNVRVQDTDHIMPWSILTAMNYDVTKINSIRNYQLIDYKTNRGNKNDKSFSAWINNPENVTDKLGFVKLHLIPPDEALWTEDRFEDFIDKRGELILNKIMDLTR